MPAPGENLDLGWLAGLPPIETVMTKWPVSQPAALDGEILPPVRCGHVRVDADGVTTRTEWPAPSWIRDAPPPVVNPKTSVRITLVETMLPAAFVEHDADGSILVIGIVDKPESERRFADGVVAEIRCGYDVYALLRARTRGQTK